MAKILAKRVEYAALRYKEFLKGQILDVGCRGRSLKKFLDKDIEYTGIDITGDCDITVDLDKGKIPFPDNSFDCVVCLDVLEHLENIHVIFDEIIRVSRKYAIISLPNCYCCNFFKIITGKGKTKYYGLPADIVKDRHRWFFNYEEGKDFILKRSERNMAEVIDSHALIKNKPLRNFVLKSIYNKNYKNIVALCSMSLIKKQD